MWYTKNTVWREGTVLVSVSLNSWVFLANYVQYPDQNRWWVSGVKILVKLDPNWKKSNCKCSIENLRIWVKILGAQRQYLQLGILYLSHATVINAGVFLLSLWFFKYPVPRYQYNCVLIDRSSLFYFQATVMRNKGLQTKPFMMNKERQISILMYIYRLELFSSRYNREKT
jgi:hypothetical protein